MQFTAPSLASLATPDFSMPYNVCCLSSTLLAVFFGAMLNALTARPRVAALQDGSRAVRRRKAVMAAVMIAAFSVLAVYLDADLHDWVLAQLRSVGYQHDSERLF